MGLSATDAISTFGKAAKQKLASPAVTGEPEDQLRAPFERLLADMAEVLDFEKAAVTSVGESSVSALKTRPDYAVTVQQALVGFIELKAPGKGADPRKFRGHDKQQWERLRALPNLMYLDGNEFSLWQDGELVGKVVKLIGDVESSGAQLQAPPEFDALFEKFLRWQPIAPGSARELAHVSARLCRLLRDEVTEQMELGSEALTSLATDWRKLLFPDATDERFADGYAQAVTFGLLMARAKGISLATGFEKVAHGLDDTSSLIGAALRFLTDNAENQAKLKTSLGTLTRVLDAVNWKKISKGKPETWLYFYEDFLEVYDNTLKKLTGSYYTPPEVVSAMIRLVDDELKGPNFKLHAGMASPTVTIADPATGTGTFLLGILRKIAATVEQDEGAGSVKGAINAAVQRVIAFELQLGPFAVAQLRLLAEIVELTGAPPKTPPRMFVTNTLGDPFDDAGWIPGILAPIGKSRKDANKIKRDEPITVVIGNPPYKEKAMGSGGWIEGQSKLTAKTAPLVDWMPPTDWKAGVHSKHLRNLYVYFWRWATWKVFDHHKEKSAGIVCFITVAGYLSGPGFQKMRDYLRRTCDNIWVIDCSPEGHQPSVSSRIFQGVQQPVCIVLASRSMKKQLDSPATVKFRSLPEGSRDAKFAALAHIAFEGEDWITCPSDWRAPFLPASTGAWTEYLPLEDLFVYNGSGVQPKRTWVIAPDAESLRRRWDALIKAPEEEKEDLFHATLRDGIPADRHIRSIVRESLPTYQATPKPLIDEKGPSVAPVRYAFRSFNRQWIIPDVRVITQPNAELWQSRSERQVYMTALSRSAPSSGPALTVTGLVPDLDHYKGSFGGRVFPLWANQDATASNFRPSLLPFLAVKYGKPLSAEDLFAYVVALAASPAYTARFQRDMSTPGLRIPITADKATFFEAAEVGRRIIWLHSFGERMTNAAKGRPAQPPRLPQDQRPSIPIQGAISEDEGQMPDTIAYDSKSKRLFVGTGFVENVSAEVWNYEVSGKQVILQWFSYRKANRERPIIGDRRAPSALGDIQPAGWLPEYTTELLNVLNVLGYLVEVEPAQAKMLEVVCSGPLVSWEELKAGGALELPTKLKKVTASNQSALPL